MIRKITQRTIALALVALLAGAVAVRSANTAGTSAYSNEATVKAK